MSKSFLWINIFNLMIFMNSHAQDCTVAMELLKGKYEGDCKNGKAEGKGKAVGTDMYEGEFKAGLPDGTGRYTWKNGDYYEGKWVHGKKEGTGTMLYKLATGDSLINGFWKKDMYAGKYEKPFIIHSKTKHVVQFSCRKENNLLNQVTIYLSSTSGGNPSGISTINADKTPQPDGEVNAVLPLVSKPQISNIQIIEGTFGRKTDNDSYGKKIVYTLEEVAFPFRAQINMGNDFVDIEFLEAGKWLIEMTLAY